MATSSPISSRRKLPSHSSYASCKYFPHTPGCLGDTISEEEFALVPSAGTNCHPIVPVHHASMFATYQAALATQSLTKISHLCHQQAQTSIPQQLCITQFPFATPQAALAMQSLKNKKLTYVCMVMLTTMGQVTIQRRHAGGALIQVVSCMQTSS